jgi:pyridoxine/pyridoxamine 5'-phosphate oxidase
LRMTKAELFGFISGCKLAVLASVSSEGVPQSALVGIAVSEELEIVFDTLDTTRKFKNLTGNCRASFVIGWVGEKTVQFEGEVFCRRARSWTGTRRSILPRGRMDQRGKAGRE